MKPVDPKGPLGVILTMISIVVLISIAIILIGICVVAAMKGSALMGLVLFMAALAGPIAWLSYAEEKKVEKNETEKH